MHRAFKTYEPTTRIGPGIPPTWMPDSTARELAERQQAYGSYQPQAPVMQTMPSAMPMQMPMVVPMPYPYPQQAIAGPTNTRARSSRHHYDSDTDSDEEHRRRRHSRHHRARQKDGRDSRFAPARDKRTRTYTSSSESNNSITRRRRRRRKGRSSPRVSRRVRTASSSSVMSTTTATSDGGTTSTSESRTTSTTGSDSASYSSSISRSSMSGSDSEEDNSSTISGHSSGRETTLTTTERLQASQRAAASLRASNLSVVGTSLPRPRLVSPPPNLFMEIQRAHVHNHLLPDISRKATLPNMPVSTVFAGTSAAGSIGPYGEATDSRPHSSYHAASHVASHHDDIPDTFARRMLPRPTLARLPDNLATRSLHPVGAHPESAFGRVGYLPVKTPQLPPEIHIQASSPPTSPRRDLEEPDPPVLSKSQPSSTRTSPREALFPPLGYDPPSPCIGSAPPSRRSMSRANSTFSNRYTPPAPSQIQAAIQHRSVSEAAFPLTHDHLAIPERACIDRS